MGLLLTRQPDDDDDDDDYCYDYAVVCNGVLWMCTTCPRQSVIVMHSCCPTVFTSSFCTQVPYALNCWLFCCAFLLYILTNCIHYSFAEIRFIYMYARVLWECFTDTKLCCVFKNLIFSRAFQLSLPYFHCFCTMWDIDARLDRFWSHMYPLMRIPVFLYSVYFNVSLPDLYGTDCDRVICIFAQTAIADRTKRNAIRDTTSELPLHASVK